jgi:hypothetical protein
MVRSLIRVTEKRTHGGPKKKQRKSPLIYADMRWFFQELLDPENF